MPRLEAMCEVKIPIPDTFTDDDAIFVINRGAKLVGKPPYGRYLLYANIEVVNYVDRLWAINSTQK